MALLNKHGFLFFFAQAKSKNWCGVIFNLVMVGVAVGKGGTEQWQWVERRAWAMCFLLTNIRKNSPPTGGRLKCFGASVHV